MTIDGWGTKILEEGGRVTGVKTEGSLDKRRRFQFSLWGQDKKKGAEGTGCRGGGWDLGRKTGRRRDGRKWGYHDSIV